METLRDELAVERARGPAVEAQARKTAARLVAEAEAHAARLRTEATVRVRGSAGRLEEVLQLRADLLGELRELTHAFCETIEGGAETPVRALEKSDAPTVARTA